MSKASESLADKAYRAIEELILTADLAPGTWIAEYAVAERVGLGRTPVREALQRLARQQLVEIVRGRGLRITDIDVRDQLLIIELRREIEMLLVRRATRHITDEERSELRDLGAEIGRLRDGSDPAAYFQRDFEFKLLLLRCARHRFASEAITPLWLASRRFSWIYRDRNEVTAFADLLGGLIRAMVAGDEAEALQITQARMDYLDRFARATLERRETTGR